MRRIALFALSVVALLALLPAIAQGENREPVADFTLNAKGTSINDDGVVSVSPGTVVTMDASISVDTDGKIISYKWTILDPDKKIEKVVDSGDKSAYNYKFENSGLYTIRLTVTDNDYATASVEKNLEVKKSDEYNMLNIGIIAIVIVVLIGMAFAGTKYNVLEAVSGAAGTQQGVALKKVQEQIRRYKREMQGYSTSGYNVSSLHNALATENIGQIARAFKKYRTNLKTLEEIGNKIQSVEAKGVPEMFKENVDEVKAHLNNPDAADALLKQWVSLERAINDYLARTTAAPSVSPETPAEEPPKEETSVQWDVSAEDHATVGHEELQGKTAPEPASSQLPAGWTTRVCKHCGHEIPVPPHTEPVIVKCDNCGKRYRIK